MLRVNMKKYFPKYVLCEEDLLKKYFLDINTRELVLIENQHEFMKSLRGPTTGHLSFNGEIYRPANQSDIDKHEEQYKTQNWNLYNHLLKIYNSYEIFLSEDKTISIHIRQSETYQDLILQRYVLEDNVFQPKECVNLAYAVRELEYCKGPTLKEKYEQLINKNLESAYIRDSLMPYVAGVFKCKKNRHDRYNSDDSD
jgi:hypothetical protein